jgi:hypothetical protein
MKLQVKAIYCLIMSFCIGDLLITKTKLVDQAMIMSFC